MAPVIVNMTYKYAKTWNDTMGDITDAKIARVDLQLLLLKFNLIYFWVDIVTPLVWEVDLDVRFHVKVSRVIEMVSVSFFTPSTVDFFPHLKWVIPFTCWAFKLILKKCLRFWFTGHFIGASDIFNFAI